MASQGWSIQLHTYFRPCHLDSQVDCLGQTRNSDVRGSRTTEWRHHIASVRSKLMRLSETTRRGSDLTITYYSPKGPDTERKDS